MTDKSKSVDKPSPQKSPPENSDHSTEPTRSTDAQKAEYVHQCKLLLMEMKGTNEICDLLRDKIGKSNSSIKRYIQVARKELKEESKADVEQVRGQHQGFLLRELRKALIASDKVGLDSREMIGLKKLSLEFYDRLVKLYPNSLQPELENPDTVFNITFKDATEEDIVPVDDTKNEEETEEEIEEETK